MKTWTWRVILSAANVLLLFLLLPRSFHGTFASSPGLYFVVTSLDLVPRAFGNMVVTYPINHHLLYSTAGYWAHFLFWEYLLMVFMFWWWIGWKIDLRLARHSSCQTWTWAEFVLCFSFSLMLLFERGEHTQALALVSIAWAVALGCYSLLQLRRGIAMLRSIRLAV